MFIDCYLSATQRQTRTSRVSKLQLFALRDPGIWFNKPKIVSSSLSAAKLRARKHSDCIRQYALKVGCLHDEIFTKQLFEIGSAGTSSASSSFGLQCALVGHSKVTQKPIRLRTHSNVPRLVSISYLQRYCCMCFSSRPLTTHQQESPPFLKNTNSCTLKTTPSVKMDRTLQTGHHNAICL